MDIKREISIWNLITLLSVFKYPGCRALVVDFNDCWRFASMGAVSLTYLSILKEGFTPIMSATQKSFSP